MAVGLREQGCHRLDLRACCTRNGHGNVGVQVKQHLSAPAARWNDSPVTVASGSDRHERASIRRGSHTQGDKFGAGATGEVMDIDSGVDPSSGVHGRGGDRVVRIATQGPRQCRGGIDDPALRLQGLHAPQFRMSRDVSDT